MQCSNCGKILKNEEVFCPQCGVFANQIDTEKVNSCLFQIVPNDSRSYSIMVNKDCVLFDGNFWYLKNKEFVKCSNKKETAQTKNFLGMGYISKRSYKKSLWFVVMGSMLEIVKVIIDKLTEWIDRANMILLWSDKTICLPDWITATMDILTIICVLLAIALLFSKKKVIEISFVDKRICVPKKSMTQSEYNMLYQSILNAKKNTQK